MHPRRAEENVNISTLQWIDVVQQSWRDTHILSLTAPRTSIDLTPFVSPFNPSLFHFPISTLATAASTHFLPSLFDAPSVEDRHAFCFGSICVDEDV